MKQVSRSALVSFSAEQMFNLVNDVAKYLNFCLVVRALELLSLRVTAWSLLSMLRKQASVKRSLRPMSLFLAKLL